jgi:hypothetical protein
MFDSDYERQQHLKNLSEECIKYKRKQRNNRYYIIKKLKEKENNIPKDNQNVNNDQNYNFFYKSNEKNNIYFENEIINVSVLDCSTNDTESNLNNSYSSISNNSNDFDEPDEYN